MNANTEELLALVDSISHLESQIREFDQQTGPLRAKMQLIRARATLQISSQRDDKGRTMYSNEKAREAAHLIHLSKDSEYQQALRQLRDLERQRELKIVEQMRLQQRHHVLMLALEAHRPASDLDPRTPPDSGA